jgi:hypothetical protein
MCRTRERKNMKKTGGIGINYQHRETDRNTQP